MIHIIISGDVQGVGFRQFVKYHANKLGIKGWVKNLYNGDVEIMLAGSPENLEKIMEIVKKGPPIALVEHVKTEELPGQEFESFEIIKD